MHLEVEQEEIIKEDDCSYISIIERFIKIMIGSNYEQDTVYNIINGCKNLSVKAFENIDKKTALKVFGYIELFAESLKIDEETIKSIKEIIKKKLKDDQLYILNPSIDNLLNGDIYILNYHEDTYYIPMWHDEITYDLSNVSLIIKCILMKIIRYILI